MSTPTGQAPAETDDRLGQAEFEARFGRILSHAIAFNAASRMVINSALTRTKYVTWNWTEQRYDVEPRRAS
jgi:hypothetical protein